MRKAASLSLIAALLLTSTALTGCFGKFALTRKVYAWNEGIGNKFAKTIVMWAMFIIPVYEVVGAGDLLIFNLLEFWTGSNPVARGPIDQRILADGSVEIHHGGVVFRVVPVGADRFDLLREGQRVGVGLARPDGGVTFTVLESGKTVDLGSPDLASLRAQAQASAANPG